jgi:hypothetical protein
LRRFFHKLRKNDRSPSLVAHADSLRVPYSDVAVFESPSLVVRVPVADELLVAHVEQLACDAGNTWEDVVYPYGIPTFPNTRLSIHNAFHDSLGYARYRSIYHTSVCHDDLQRCPCMAFSFCQYPYSDHNPYSWYTLLDSELGKQWILTN